MLRPALALAAAAAVVVAAASPPGRAVIDSVREAVGVEQADEALFSLPASGRLLVTSDAGAWLVRPDGSRRLLGAYREASWSPRGLFVVAVRDNELTALEPDGDVRWTLARPEIRFPRWGGTRTDTRIAYLTGSRLHVVGGDGRGDVDAGGLPAAARVAPAWRPGPRHVVAYVTTRGRVYVYDSDAGSLLSRSARYARPRRLAWSADGSRLLLVTSNEIVILEPGRGRAVATLPLRGVVDATFSPRGTRVAVVRAQEVLLVDARRPRRGTRVFAGAGRFTSVTWSPDARWLLVGWRDADQWVFIRVGRTKRLRAVANVSQQFESGAFPNVSGWCCP